VKQRDTRQNKEEITVGILIKIQSFKDYKSGHIKKDLYHAMMRAWEDIFTKTMPSELDNTEHGISMPGEEESLH
jgi:hypothetical protein